MIKLEKGEEPTVLRANAQTWLVDLKNAIASGDKKDITNKTRKYNHQDIKDALIAETSGKCCYCESDVRAVSHGDIEHIYPKSLDVEKTFEWDNLSFSCQLCNQYKSNKDPLFNNIIDPFNVNPKQYIMFVGAFINSFGTTEGRMTIHNLGLDRAPLFERRQEAFKGLILFLDLINGAKTEDDKKILIKDFEANELSRSKEFTAMRRDFWSAFKPQA